MTPSPMMRSLFQRVWVSTRCGLWGASAREQCGSPALSLSTAFHPNQPEKGAGTGESEPGDVMPLSTLVWLCQSSPHFLFFVGILQVLKNKALPTRNPIPKALESPPGCSRGPSDATQNCSLERTTPVWAACLQWAEGLTYLHLKNISMKALV